MTLRQVAKSLSLECPKAPYLAPSYSPYTSLQLLLSSLTRVLISTNISQFSASVDLQTLESALEVLSQWFSLNCLALNPDTSDATLLDTRQHNNSLSNSFSLINVTGSIVPLAETVKHLSVTLDKPLTFHKHVDQVSQSCHYHMKALRHIRHCLDDR